MLAAARPAGGPEPPVLAILVKTSAPLLAASIFLGALNVFLFILRIFSGDN